MAAVGIKAAMPDPTLNAHARRLKIDCVIDTSTERNRSTAAVMLAGERLLDEPKREAGCLAALKAACVANKGAAVAEAMAIAYVAAGFGLADPAHPLAIALTAAGPDGGKFSQAIFWEGACSQLSASRC
jgi:hypothetical protein